MSKAVHTKEEIIFNEVFAEYKDARERAVELLTDSYPYGDTDSTVVFSSIKSDKVNGGYIMYVSITVEN